MSSSSHLVAVCAGLVSVFRPPAGPVYLRSCGRVVHSIRLPGLRLPLPLPVHAVLPQPRRFLHQRTVSPTVADAAGDKGARSHREEGAFHSPQRTGERTEALRLQPRPSVGWEPSQSTHDTPGSETAEADLWTCLPALFTSHTGVTGPGEFHMHKCKSVTPPDSHSHNSGTVRTCRTSC